MLKTEIASLIDYLENQIPEQQTEEGRQIIRYWIAALSPSEQPGPVAWRWRFDDEGAWFYGSEQPSDKPPHRSMSKAQDVQPLYAQPSEQTGGGGVEEVAREARTTLSILRTQVMVEIGRCADPSESRWEGVPEKIKERIDAIDAALSTPEVGK